MFQHHWSDVSAGALIGVVSASLTARYISCLITGYPPAAEKSSRDLHLAGSANNTNRSQTNYDVESARSAVPKDQPIPPRSSREH